MLRGSAVAKLLRDREVPGAYIGHWARDVATTKLAPAPLCRKALNVAAAPMPRVFAIVFGNLALRWTAPGVAAR